MKFQYASDLHLEFDCNKFHLLKKPMKVVGDVLLLVGDVMPFRDLATLKNCFFFDWCADNFEQTLIVPGNHEYYGTDNLLEQSLDGYEYSLRPNVRYLNNKSMAFGDTEVFLTTLWTKVRGNEILSVKRNMLDYGVIPYRDRFLHPDDNADLHKICLDWLESAMASSQAEHRIVVSHHCPTVRFIPPRYKDSKINSAFTVDIEPFMERVHPDYWIFGHTHNPGGNDELIGTTRLKTNQLGYVDVLEHHGFIRDSFIEI